MTERPQVSQDIINHYLGRMTERPLTQDQHRACVLSCYSLRTTPHPKTTAVILSESNNLSIQLAPYSTYAFFPFDNPDDGFHAMAFSHRIPGVQVPEFLLPRHEVIAEVLNQKLPDRYQRYPTKPADDLEVAKRIEREFALQNFPTIMMSLNFPIGTIGDDIVGVLYTAHGISPETGITIIQQHASAAYLQLGRPRDRHH